MKRRKLGTLDSQKCDSLHECPAHHAPDPPLDKSKEGIWLILVSAIQDKRTRLRYKHEFYGPYINAKSLSRVASRLMPSHRAQCKTAKFGSRQ